MMTNEELGFWRKFAAVWGRPEKELIDRDMSDIEQLDGYQASTGKLTWDDIMDDDDDDF